MNNSKDTIAKKSLKDKRCLGLEQGGWRNVSAANQHFLFFQRICAWFPASTWWLVSGDLTVPLTSARDQATHTATANISEHAEEDKINKTEKEDQEESSCAERKGGNKRSHVRLGDTD